MNEAALVVWYLSFHTARPFGLSVSLNLRLVRVKPRSFLPVVNISISIMGSDVLKGSSRFTGVPRSRNRRPRLAATGTRFDG